MKAVSMEKPWKFCQTWTKCHLILHAHADGKCQFVIHVLTFSLKEIHLLLSERALVILAFKLLFSDEIYKSNRFESYSSGAPFTSNLFELYIKLSLLFTL